MAKKNESEAEKRKHTQNYVKFLEKRIASKNYKKSVSEEEFKKEKAKLEKARLVLKLTN